MNIRRVKFKDIEQVPHLQVNKNFKTNFLGSAPAPFIGRYGYPHVNIGLLSPQYVGEMEKFDSPALWSERNFPIGTVASLRYGLVNSRSKAVVQKLQGRFLEMVQEVGMAKKAAEVEVNLKKTPSLNLKPDKEVKPFGPQASVHTAKITANTKVDSRVEKVVYDTDLKSQPAILSLYNKGFEESSLNKLLSVGNLGLKNNRKLVPTRWSITAVDDTVGKELIKEVKDYPPGEYLAHFGGSWGNYYLLLFFQEVWSYELFETYLSSEKNPWSKNGLMYSTDYENYEGRKSYAEETAGGYYAARLGVLEQMKRKKRQYSCLALRFITSEYNVPLGVWVCREATRKSLQEKPLRFATEQLLLQYGKELIKRKFGFNLDFLLKESKLIKEKKMQKKLSEFH